MSSSIFAALVEGAIPILVGLYATLLGHRVLGKKPGQSIAYDQWHDRIGKKLQVIGPLITVFGFVLMIIQIAGTAAPQAELAAREER